MDSHSQPAALIIVTLPLFGLLLAGCANDDPEVQVMRAVLRLPLQLFVQANSCLLFLEVTRRSGNRPLDAAIPVKADWQRRWTFPGMPGLFHSLKPRGSYARLPVVVPGGDVRPASTHTEATPNAPETVSGRAGSTATTVNTSSGSNSRASRSSPPPPVPDAVYKKRFNWGD